MSHESVSNRPVCHLFLTCFLLQFAFYRPERWG
jgi:hypothetical protein